MFRKATSPHALRGFRTIAPTAVCTQLLMQTILATAVMAQGPATIRVPGIVRDFQAAHPDFNVVPAAGYGHYAANLALTLDASYRPQFTGAGFLVGPEWKDKYGNNIAPHLYQPGVVVPVLSSPSVDKNSIVDTYDPADGAYNVATAGAAPGFESGSPMPLLLQPAGLPPPVNEVRLSNKGMTMLSADLHCNRFIVETTHQVIIDGNRTMLVEELFNLRDISTVVQVPAGSSLTIYFKKTFRMEDQAVLNSSDHPERVRIVNLGTEELRLEDQARLSAHVISPSGTLAAINGAQFFGTFVGESVYLENSAGFHLDESWTLTTCGDSIEDENGIPSAAGTGGITSAATFDQWYTDVLGINLSQVQSISLVRDGAGVYSFSDADFFPIDDRLYGNEGMTHNYFFTLTFSASFTYSTCGKQYFRFAGSDDAWLYINGRLVIDLGGVVPGEDQVIELDRLDLVDGEVYTMHFFFAQRNPNQSSFDIRTNAVLMPQTLVGAGSASFD